MWAPLFTYSHRYLRGEPHCGLQRISDSRNIASRALEKLLTPIIGCPPKPLCIAPEV